MAKQVKVSKTAKNSNRNASAHKCASIFNKIWFFLFGSSKKKMREDYYSRYTRAHIYELEEKLADVQAENSKLHAWVIYSGQTLNYDKFSRAVGVIKVKA